MGAVIVWSLSVSEKKTFLQAWLLFIKPVFSVSEFHQTNLCKGLSTVLWNAFWVMLLSWKSSTHTAAIPTVLQRLFWPAALQACAPKVLRWVHLHCSPHLNYYRESKIAYGRIPEVRHNLLYINWLVLWILKKILCFS